MRMDRARIVHVIEQVTGDEAAEELAYEQARSEWERVLLALWRNAAARFAASAHVQPGSLAAAGDEQPPQFSRPDPDEIVPASVVAQVTRTFKDAAQFYAQRLLRKGADELTRAGVAFNTRSPLMEGVLPEKGLRITRITDTMRAHTMEVLDDAWRQGASIPQARDALRARGLAYSRERATMIARTEIVGARNGASVAMAKITGVATMKVWLATEDERTRPTHVEADGQVVPLDAAFDVGGSMLEYPGDQNGPPEEVINCRCTVTYEVPDEEEAVVAAVETGVAWRAVLMREDTWTADGRWFAPGSVTWRELPLTLMAQTETAAGHDGARVAGRIDRIERDGNAIVGWGVFDAGDDGVEAARLVGEQVLRGISVDYGDVDVEVQESETDDGMFVFTEKYAAATLLGATITPFPAFAEAVIELDDGNEGGPALEPDLVPDEDDAVTAAAAPTAPPAAWFDAPRLSGPTPLTIDASGRVYGHVALWGTCHVGNAQACLQPPRSASSYQHFHLGEIETAEGERVAVGQITMNAPHASLQAAPGAAAAHYDHTGTAAADVRAGEDAHGIWVAGAVRPGIDAVGVRTLRAAKPSGDWRRIGGVLELVGLLAVNVPGFPVPRARVAGGAPLALVASTGQPPHRERDGAVRYAPQTLDTSTQPFADGEARRLITAARTSLPRLIKSARGR